METESEKTQPYSENFTGLDKSTAFKVDELALNLPNEGEIFTKSNVNDNKRSSRIRRKPPPDLLIPDIAMLSQTVDLNSQQQQQVLSNNNLIDNLTRDSDNGINKYHNSLSGTFMQPNHSVYLNNDFSDGGTDEYQSPDKDGIQASSSSLYLDQPLLDTYKTSSSSLTSKTHSAPYPSHSPIVPSPTSLSYDNSISSDPPGFNIESSAYTDDSSTYKLNKKLAINGFNRTYSTTTTNTTKSTTLRPTISTPITNLNSVDSIRNSVGVSIKLNHRKSSSVGSILSAGSNRNLNLATLKKTLNLKPGEGDRSHYVLSLRRNAGTAFNETGPGTWKLPTGIAPIDKRSTYNSNNGAYMRMAGGTSNKAKKGSGVELKHGHLAPRLLAAEVDDFEELSIPTQLDKSKSSNSSIIMPHTSPSVHSNLSSLQTSLSRTMTTTSTSSQTQISKESKRSSLASGSSGSISDGDVNVGRYYQHPAYKYDDTGDNSKGDQDETEIELDDGDDDDDDDDEPKLFLANPDNYNDDDSV